MISENLEIRPLLIPTSYPIRVGSGEWGMGSRAWGVGWGVGLGRGAWGVGRGEWGVGRGEWGLLGYDFYVLHNWPLPTLIG